MMDLVKTKVMAYPSDMDNKKIKQEAHEFWDSTITLDEALGYVSDVCGEVIGSEPYPPEEVLGALKFAIEAVATYDDYDLVKYHYDNHVRDYRLKSKNDGYFETINDVIEHVEDRVFDFTEMYCAEPLTRGILFVNIKSSEHKYILVRYAILSVLLEIRDVLDVDVADIMGRYETAKQMKTYVLEKFNPQSLALNSHEKKFIKMVNKFAEDFHSKLKNSDIFGANLKTK